MTVAVSERLPSNWWLALLEGIAALILGVLLIAAPKVTVTTIILFIGIYWLVDGILSVIRIFVRDTDRLTEWEDNGDEARLIDYYTQWEYTYRGSIRPEVSTTEQYVTIKWDPHAQKTSISL